MAAAGERRRLDGDDEVDGDKVGIDGVRAPPAGNVLCACRRSC
jgi:hypothetical protein